MNGTGTQAYGGTEGSGNMAVWMTVTGTVYSANVAASTADQQMLGADADFVALLGASPGDPLPGVREAMVLVKQGARSLNAQTGWLNGAT